MNIRDLFKGTDVKELKKKNEILTEHVRNLSTTVASLQATIDPLTNTETNNTSAYKGNAYDSYLDQVQELADKYDGIATWGNTATKNIIDVRSAFTTGQGLQVMLDRDQTMNKPKGTGDRELAFAFDFLKYNNLDEEMLQEYAKEAEIEGKVLFKLEPVEKDKMVKLVHVPYLEYRYEIGYNPLDFFNYTRAYLSGGTYGASYTGNVQGVNTNAQTVSFDLAPDLFVYKRFGGRSCKIVNTPPKTAYVLRYIECLDQAMWDWRQINKLFAAPTPYFNAETAEQARLINAELEQRNWRIGKAFAATQTDFKLVGWAGEGYTSLEKEVENYIKLISGTTGVPVHFLGYPELLANRATGDSLIELIVLSTNKERKLWVGVYSEILTKAITLQNEMFQGGLNAKLLKVNIPFVSSAKVKEIADVWLPLYQANACTLDMLLRQLSGEYNIEQEKEAIEKQVEEKTRREAIIAGRGTSNANPGDSGNGGAISPEQNKGKGSQSSN